MTATHTTAYSLALAVSWRQSLPTSPPQTEFRMTCISATPQRAGRPSSSRFGTSIIQVPVSLTISPTANRNLSDIYVTRTSTHWKHPGSIVRFSGALEKDGRRQCARGGDTRSVHFYTHCLKEPRSVLGTHRIYCVRTLWCIGQDTTTGGQFISARSADDTTWHTIMRS